MSKARIEVEAVESRLTPKRGIFTCSHLLNPMDLPILPELYDLISMPPVSLLQNARFNGEYVEFGDVLFSDIHGVLCWCYIRRPPMPISTLISLIPETDVALRPTMGHHAHAALLAILRESNPEIAETLHAQSTHQNRLQSHRSSRKQDNTETNSISERVPTANSGSRFLMTPTLCSLRTRISEI